MSYKPDTYEDFKDSVRAATTGNITLSGLGTQGNGDWSGALTAGDRVLVKNQSTGAENGIYDVASGSWTRSRDGDRSGELTAGTMVTVEEGATLADTTWTITTDDPIVIDTTAITFAQLSGGGSTALEPAFRRSWFGV